MGQIKPQLPAFSRNRRVVYRIALRIGQMIRQKSCLLMTHLGQFWIGDSPVRLASAGFDSVVRGFTVPN